MPKQRLTETEEKDVNENPPDPTQEQAAIDREIDQVNEDTGAHANGGKTDGNYTGEGDYGGDGGNNDNPYNI